MHYWIQPYTTVHDEGPTGTTGRASGHLVPLPEIGPLDHKPTPAEIPECSFAEVLLGDIGGGRAIVAEYGPA